MNVSAIPRSTLIGRALRWPFGLLPRDLEVRILQGRLRGKRWIVGSGVNGYWLGSYEWDKRATFERVVRPGNVVFDVGANVGFYTLLASELVGPAGRVFAFEPLPRNAGYLGAHLSLNHAANATMVQAAVWHRSGKVRFDFGVDHSQGRATESSGIEVDAVTLDDFVGRNSLPPPNVIKIDIEGGEFDALRGATKVLTRGRPVILLATHGESVHRDCCNLLTDLGYELESLPAGKDVQTVDELVARKP